MAWLAGNLAAGGASFIPGIGLIVGTVADIRDAVGSAIHLDWVGVGFAAVGLVPVLGDTAAVPAKVGRFLARAPNLRTRTAQLVVSVKQLPERTRLAAFKEIWKEWDKLRANGFSESSLIRLQQKSMDLDHLADVMARPGHVAGPRTPFFTHWRGGEEFLEKHYRKTAKSVEPQKQLRTGGCVDVCNPTNVRRVDLLVDGVAHESKVGLVPLSDPIRREIQSDAHLIRTGQIDGAHWHFFASDTSGTMGPHRDVLALLEEHGIKFTIHPPK